MSIKDSIEKRLREKKTEEVKPGLFVQPIGKGYRKINPLVWNGEWKLRNQFSWKNLIWILIVLFLAWSYNNDTEQLVSFYNLVHEDPIYFCEQVYVSLQAVECTDFQRKAGLCLENVGIDTSTIIRVGENGTGNSTGIS